MVVDRQDQDYRELLERAIADSWALSSWEIDFLDDLSAQIEEDGGKRLSAIQRDRLDEIATKLSNRGL